MTKARSYCCKLPQETTEEDQAKAALGAVKQQLLQIQQLYQNWTALKKKRNTKWQGRLFSAEKMFPYYSNCLCQDLPWVGDICQVSLLAQITCLTICPLFFLETGLPFHYVFYVLFPVCIVEIGKLSIHHVGLQFSR